MSSLGENFNTAMVTSVTITDGTTTLVINPAIATSANSGTAGVVAVDAYRKVRHNYHGSLPVFTGPVTVTMSVPGTVQAHYTFNNRTPTHKASKKDSVDATGINARTNHSRDGAARVYEGAITVENSRPGTNLTVLKVRTYKKTALNDMGVSPNEKSKLLVIKFVVNGNSWD